MTAVKLPQFANFIIMPEPTQQRSRQALKRLLAAGEQLLAQNQFEQAGVALIAQQAESSVGTFYRLLGDKDTLLQLLLQNFFQNSITTIQTLTDLKPWSRLPLEHFVQSLVQTLADLYQGRRGVLRALILKASQDIEFRNNVHQLNEFIAKAVVNILAEHLKEMHHPKPTKAMQVIVHVLLGALNQHTVTGNLGYLTDDEVKEELARVVIAYLDIYS
ncbi:TetR/AcrR family transcriptional regulator [Thalassotalea euphylliae]|uniref:TetR/AcrR family transcriptional regulator n=1 Tax=Thalassotalea euphylliae TaxID=1655234 RepID=A0A3E0U407_9GAMM|nr:TetR/AcrR family transcriptional regulator [Thalassotalea euphylliae]REL31317.1 TetR/AcrR family transcriptional regulator [Thalassotalea euphylliae]